MTFLCFEIILISEIFNIYKTESYIDYNFFFDLNKNKMIKIKINNNY